MAKKTEYLNANLTYTDTFSKVVETINTIQYDLATVVVTTAPQNQPDLDNGGQTNGNTHINGILSSNTGAYIDGIRGGTVSASDTLHILSDASFEGANVVVQSGTDTYIKDQLFVSANASFTGDDLFVDITDTLTLDAANNIDIISPDIDVDSANVTIGTDGTDALTINSDTSLTANVVIGTDSSDQLDINANTDFNNNVNIDGTFTTTNNVTLGSTSFDTLTVNADSTFTFDVEVEGVLTATNNVIIGSDDEGDSLTVYSDATFRNNVTIGQTEADELLTVNANTQINNDVYIGSDNTDTLDVVATSTFHNNVTIGDDGTDDLTINSNTAFTDDVHIEETLQVDGNVQLGNAASTDTVTVTANTVLGGELHVTGQTKLNGNATVGDASTDTMTVEATTTFKADVTIGDSADGADNLTVNANTTFTDDVKIEETLTVDGDVTIGNDTDGGTTLTVNANTFYTDDVHIDETLDVDGAVTFNSTLDVDGATTLNGNVTLGDNTSDTVTIEGAADFNHTANFDGSVTMNGNVTVGTGTDGEDTLTVNANTTFTDDVVMDETLSVTGVVDFSNTLTVDGATDLNATLNVDGDTTLNASVTIGDNAANDDDVLTVNANTQFNNDVYIGSNSSDVLSVAANTEFLDDVHIVETLTVDGNVQLGNAASTDTLTVDAISEFNGAVTVDGDFTTTAQTTIGNSNIDTLTVNADAIFTFDVEVEGVLTTTNTVIIGSTDEADTMTVYSASQFNNDVTIGDDASNDNDTLTVNANAAFNNDVYIGSDSNDVLSVVATTTFSGDVTIGDTTDGADNLTVNANTDFSDDVRIAETLSVTGAVDFGNTLYVENAITGNNSLTITGTTTLNGDVDLGDANTDTITFTGEVDSNIIPAANATHNLGSADDQWDNIYTADAHVTANTNTGKVVINQSDAEIVVSTTDGDTAAHGTLTVQFDHANTEVANVETVTFTSTTIEPVTNDGVDLGTSTKAFGEAFIGDSHINSTDIDIVASNTITLDAGSGILLEMDDTNDIFAVTANTATFSNELTVDGNVVLGSDDTDSHTINGVTLFTSNVSIEETLDVDGSTTFGTTEGTHTHTFNGDVTVNHDLTVSKTLTVTKGTTLKEDITLGSTTTTGHIIPSANTVDSQGVDATNGWANLGSSTKYFRNIYVDTINSPNFNLHDLNNVDSDTTPGNDDHQKVYAWSNTANEFQLTTVAALAGSGIGVTDLRDVNDDTLANSDIIIVTDSTSSTPFQNLELEMNLITDAVTYDKGAGSYSIGIGEGALISLDTEGLYNTALGKNALTEVSTGDNNVGIGSGAGSNLTTGSGNIYIGRSVQASAEDASNEIVIGTSAITDFKLGTILTANSSEVAVATNRELTANTAALAGTLSLNNSDSLAFESGKHWITYNDGGGNFNIRVGHYDNADGHAESTEAGYAFHDTWTQSSGIREWRVSDAALTVGDLDNETAATAAGVNDFGWRTQIQYDADSVELSYQGSKTFETVSGGVSVTGTLATSGNATVGGDLTVTGNLEVQGTRTYLNTTQLDVEDNIIVLNKNYVLDPEGEGAVEIDAGIEVERGTATNVSLIWDESANRWAFTNDGSAYNTLPTTAEQYKFKTIAVNSNGAETSTNVEADTRTDTLNLHSAPITYTDENDNEISTNGIDIVADTGTDTITIKHADTSAIVGAQGTAGVTSITVDDYGHVTAVSTATYDNYVKWVLSANGSTTDITSQNTLTITDQDGIDTYLSGTDTLNIKNSKPFDKLVIKGNAVGTKDITNEDQINFIGNTDITVAVSNTSATNFIVDIDHDDITRTDSTSTASPNHSDDFTVVDSITTSATGHVTAVNVKTVTLPDIYSLPTASATVKGGVKVGTGLTIDTNAILSVDAFALHRVIVTQTSTSSFSFTDATAGTNGYAVPFNTREHYDQGVYSHNTATNNSRVYVDVDGVYEINYMVGINPNGAARSVVEAMVTINGSPLPYRARSYERGNSYGDSMVVQQSLPPIDMNAGDYIEVKLTVHHEEGTYTYAIIPAETTLSVKKVGTEAPGNTWRPIDDVPANGATTTSVSSNWAFDHRDGDGTITAGSKGEASNVSPGYGGTFKIPRITYDSSGHLTAASDVTITLPAADADNTLNQVLTAGNTSTIGLHSGDILVDTEDNTAGNLALRRSGGASANGHTVGLLSFTGNNADSVAQSFGSIGVEIRNNIAGSEDSRMLFNVQKNSANWTAFEISGETPLVRSMTDFYISNGADLKLSGATYTTSIGKVAPTANRSIDFPNASGTVALTSDLTSFLTAESDTLATVTTRGNTTTNSIKIGDLNFNSSANSVMDAGGTFWFQGLNSVSNSNGVAKVVIGNSSYDWDDNGVSTLELRQYGYSSSIGLSNPVIVAEKVSRNRIDFKDKQQNSASGADSTSANVLMAVIEQQTTYINNDGKNQYGILNLQTFNSSNTTNGAISNAEQIEIGEGVIKFTTNNHDVLESIVFNQAVENVSGDAKTLWQVDSLDHFYIYNDKSGPTYMGTANDTNNGSCELIIQTASTTNTSSTAGDIFLNPSSDTLYMRGGGSSTQQLQFQLNANEQYIQSSDELQFRYGNTGGIVFRPRVGITNSGNYEFWQANSSGQQTALYIKTYDGSQSNATIQFTRGTLNIDAAYHIRHDSGYGIELNAGYGIDLNVQYSGYPVMIQATNTGNYEKDDRLGIYPHNTGYVKIVTANTAHSDIQIHTAASGLNTTFSGEDVIVQGDVTSLSDVRTKENIETIDNGLEVVVSLRGVRYNKIGEEERKVGVIAQEVEEVLPEVVRTDDEGMKSVDYGKMVGVLIEAMKEQQSQIEALKAEIEKLKE